MCRTMLLFGKPAARGYGGVFGRRQPVSFGNPLRTFSRHAPCILLTAREQG